jgi:hypothetical protein
MELRSQIRGLGEFGQLEIVERGIRATQQEAEGCANFGFLGLIVRDESIGRHAVSLF